MCGSRNIAQALPLARSAIGNDYLPTVRPQPDFSLTLWLCSSCGNVQIEDVVHPDLLFRSYTYATASSLGLIEHFRRYAAEAVTLTKAGLNSLIVDIGSNDGSLLRAFRDLGFRVVGVDPAVEIARRAASEGIETLPEYFDVDIARGIVERYGQAAIVTANNVFAHSDRLPDMADGVRRLLRPDGVFLFEVSYLLDIVQNMLFDTVYHEHLCYHSVTSLSAFFRAHDLQLVDIQRIPTKGGSLRGTVQVAGAPRTTSPVIDRMIEAERDVRLHSLETFAAFGERIRSAKDACVSLLDRLRTTGKTIAGYGASPTVTTLLHQFELGRRIDLLVDDNPAKQNTFSPGHHIPVHAPDALGRRGIDVVAILAWNYADAIMTKNRRFTDKGGRFIVPLPTLRTI